MPWFKIDDSAHSHPKFIRAGNAALGLWVRCGAYSAQHLLEGIVPGFTAKAFGSPAQAQKLIKAGLWHAVDHNCPRCPQPDAGDFVIHDFFEGGRNSTRLQVEASRKTAADRQARQRARAADQAAMDDRNENRTEIAVKNEPTLGSEKFKGMVHSAPQFQDGAAGQEGSSRRDAFNGVTPSQAKPVLTTTYGRQDALAGVQIPAWTQPLIDALATKGISVSWARLGSMQWAAIQQLIEARGVDRLANIAASRWNPRDPIKFASLLLTIWLEHPLPSAPGSAARDSPADQRPPYCGDPDCDAITRTRDAEDAKGIRSSVPCHLCHPTHKEPAA